MMDSKQLTPLPKSLDRFAFLEAYGGIYESSPWVAEGVWEDVLQGNCDTADAMRLAMQAIVEDSGRDKQLKLIRAHPELAGRAAIAGDLTDASTKEQAGAGLDQCTPDEFTAFQSLNTTHNATFSFPFIIAVSGLGRTDILTIFRARLSNDYETEFAAALAEIHKIAAIRLNALTISESP